MNNLYTSTCFTASESQVILDDVVSEEYAVFKRSRLYELHDNKKVFKEIPNERRSYEQVFHDHSRFAWIKSRVTGHVKQALSQFNMDMKEINYPQGLRFIKYDSSELGFQNWHTDKSKDTRILSCVIQLSDPLSYTGANLEFESRRLSNEVSREQGSINIFPSGQIHRVTECTSGIRYSLVIWAEETNDELPEGFVNGQ